MLAALAESDLRARYGRGRWKLAKWLFDPFAALGVYLVLVVFVLDLPGDAPGLSIACAVVPFQLVVMVVSSSLTAIRLRRSIVMNMRFDRALIPLATVLTEAVAFAAALVLLVLTMAVSGVSPTVQALWLPVFIALTLLVSVALAYPSALCGLWFPDANLFVVSLVRAMFFVAPGLVALDAIPDGAATVLKLNPLSGLFEGYRDALLYGTAPEAWQVLVPLCFSAAVLALAVPLYLQEQDHFAKVVE